MNDKTKMSFRLALRVEGDWWVAYMAKPDTMEGARRLGSILLGVVADPVRKQLFMDLMKGALDQAVEAVTGSPPTHWDERPAPEAERAGRA